MSQHDEQLGHRSDGIAIELVGLSKQYGDVTALNNVSLTVREGEIFGFLGPNGAGKSTTIDILLDFVRPSAGTATVLGDDAQTESLAVRQAVGVLPDGYHLYDRLTARQHLEFAIASKESDDDPIELLERVGIADAADRKAGGFSKGMKQRLVLAMALAGSPELLILDEPSTGLDPNGAREMREIIRAERDRGATVFFSSHILEQVEAVCDRVGILRNGELVAVDTIDALRDALGTDTRLVLTVESVTDDMVDAVATLPDVTGVHADSETRVTVMCAPDAKTAVIHAVEAAGGTVVDFDVEETSLEEMFAAYTTDDDTATSSADEDDSEVVTPSADGQEVRA
ncbi:ABC transporter ATP-binding protein [Halorubrum sp. Eb13]|uniref:ABC transporter ATP-binding protein n=1 Tax=Halorubrum sp. Eb13 TaxID=1383843 RepID=UPI000B98519C|nr:ABC transporter ATP-binding protein [Halorubrum sp. Eb13]OYR44127.1 copper ABC transporter ATP-binding protein [Halorubrum sp. Eb13]